MRIVYACLTAVWILAGCAPYSNSFAPIERDIQDEKYAAALARLDGTQPAARDSLLHELNRATLLRMMGSYKESTESYERAKVIIDQFDAVSVSEQTSAMLVNDGMAAYSGEQFERVFVHIFSALNYLSQGDTQGARVEVLQADQLLQTLNGKYSTDALMHYLSGVIFEALGEQNDALIAYRHAYDDYKNGFFGVPLPPQLKLDLIRTTARLRFTQENRQYRQEFGIEGAPAWDRNDGELIVIVSTGLVPIKRAHDDVVSLPTGVYRLSLPYYVQRPRYGSAPTLAVSGSGAEKSAQLERFSDVARIATATLDDQMAGIVAKTVARMVAKEVAARAVGQASAGNGNNNNAALVSLVANLFNAVTEVADTRSWLTLPDEVYIARLRLPSGLYNVQLGVGGAQKRYNGVVIEAGKRQFLTPHLIDRYHSAGQ